MDQNGREGGGPVLTDGLAEAIVATVREPLLVLDGGLRVRAANRSFYRTFRVRPGETEGRPLFDLGDGQWAIPALRTLLGEVLPRDAAFDDFEVEHVFPGVGRKVMLLNARKLWREGTHTELILLAIEDVTALRETERARQDAEARFSEMVKNVRDLSIFLTDPDGVITSWNVAAERIIGYVEAEVVGQPFSLIFTPEDIAAGVPGEELRQARQDGRAEDERWHRRKDGSRFWALGIVTPLHDPAGRLTGYSKILRDMTDRKRAEEELASSRTRLQAVFDTSQDALLLADDAARFTDANPAACTLLGYGREELLRRRVFDITPRANGDAGRAAWAAFVRDGHQEGEYEVRRRDGSTGVVEFRAVANVQPGLHLSALRDVTDRRRGEEALRASEQRFRTLATHAPVGIFQTDPDGRCLFVNDRWCEIAGLSPSDAAGEGWARALHPDDRDRIREAWYAAAAAGREFATEYRFLTPDGRTAWVRGHAVALRDDGGAVTGHLGTVADITGERAAAEALRESEHRLRTLSDNLPDGAVYQTLAGADGSRRFVFISAGVERLFGVTSAEATVDAGALYGLVHEDDRPRLAAAEETALRDSTPFDCEFRSWTRGGDLRWVHCRSAPRRLPDGKVVWEGIILDVTARKEGEQRLRASEERFRTLFEAMDEGYCVIEMIFDPPGGDRAVDYRFLEVNPAFEAQSGMRDVTGRRMREFVADIEDHWLANYGRVALTGEPVRFANVYTGLNRWFEVYAFRVGGAGSRRVGVLFTDITRRKQAEADRERLVDQLRDADRRKDDFLATLAHELRNPLAPLRNGLEVMKLAAGDPTTVERSQAMMERQLGQMVHLIDDLLDVSRITRGKLLLRRERVELAAVVQAAVESSRPLVEAAGHRLTVALSGDPVWLDGDPTRLTQVFANLLTNAAKYTERGGDIRVTAGRDGGGVAVSVTDTGIGIAPEHLPRLFEMFSQVDSALERSQGGLGIGLSLVKGLVEMHNGTVEAHSEGPGRGSTFTVRLPPAGEAGPTSL